MKKRELSYLCKAAIFILAILLLALPSCSNAELPCSSQIDSYAIADSTGDWGFPSPYAHYPRGPGYVRMSFIFETLVWKDSANFVPQLALEWNYSESDNSYTFKLREGVKWHDGTDFTAEDVAFTFNYTKEHPYQFVDNGIVKTAEAIDEHMVKLYLSHPYAPFLQDVAGAQPIIPQHIWKNVAAPEEFVCTEATIGTGPYTLADYSQEHGTYLYTAFGGYYLGDPAVKEIKFVRLAPEIAPAALKDGVVNAASIPAEAVTDMKSAGLTVIEAPVSWNGKLSINHLKEPLSSREFRQALAYAIDCKQLVEIVFRGNAIAGSPGMMPPTSTWYNPDTPQYEYDPEKARHLLENMGYRMEGKYLAKRGQLLQLSLISAADYKDVGQLIARQLQQVGVDVDFQTLESKTVDSRIESWNFDLVIYGHGGIYDPSIMQRFILGESFNSARYKVNDELTQLLKAQLIEMDPNKRREMVFQIQEIYADDVPSLTLYYPESYWAHDDNLSLYYTMDGIAIGVPIPLNRMAFVEQ
jgi:peptide/nickel transport system substrate-binding protein